MSTSSQGLGTFDGNRPPSAAGVGFTQFHLQVFQVGDLAVFITDDTGRCGQEVNLTPFVLGRVDFDLVGRHFLARPAVDDG